MQPLPLRLLSKAQKKLKRSGCTDRANVYPNISAQQKVVLVPGAFGSTVNHFPNGTYVCDRQCYDEMCTLDAHEFYAWAKSDERVVAIAPWNWGGCPGCNGSHWTPPNTCCMDEIGAKDQPKTRAAWERIGDEIKDNAKARQGSVASRLWTAETDRATAGVTLSAGRLVQELWPGR